MAKPAITIIGLGLTGASLGQALQRQESEFEIIGHDRDPQAAQAARKSGAVHRTEWNLHASCENSDLIITAVPLAELDELYGQIAEDIKPGCLVFGIVSLVEPAIAIGDRHVPDHAHFVAGHPVLSGVGGALTTRADLFDDVVFSIASGTHTDASAIQLAADFVTRIGATPIFVDALEHDGIMAGVEQLPQLLGASLMHMSAAAPGWREARRMAGRQFAQATELGGSAEQLAGSFRANRQHLLYRLRRMQEELERWADLLESEPAEGEDDALLTALIGIEDERIEWEAHARLKNWEESASSSQSRESGEPGMLRQMFFGNMFGRRPPSGRR